MKHPYIIELEELLAGYVMDQAEVNDILEDYQEMYDNYLDYGMTHDQIREKLGEPTVIIHDLTEGFVKKTVFKQQQAHSRNNKIVALSPFIALFIFFILGFAYDAWAYSWVAFLLIPVIAIITNTEKTGETIIALTPFIAVIGYGILGFGFDLWHPGWLIFLIIPVTAILIEVRKNGLLDLLTALSPFVALVIFFLYFGENDLWVPGWLIFLMIPAIGAFHEKNKLRFFIIELLLLGGAGLYLYIGSTYDMYDWALFAFVPITIYALVTSEGSIINIPKEYRIIILIAGVIYIGLGLLSPVVGYNLWAWAWLIFFLIPVYAILTEADKNEQIVAIMPFISVVIFYTLGFFFGWWAYSWMAFLLIPVVAIIKEA
jgi:uncharacterized membrane protein